MCSATVKHPTNGGGSRHSRGESGNMILSYGHSSVDRFYVSKEYVCSRDNTRCNLNPQ